MTQMERGQRQPYSWEDVEHYKEDEDEDEDYDPDTDKEEYDDATMMMMMDMLTQMTTIVIVKLVPFSYELLGLEWKA